MLQLVYISEAKEDISLQEVNEIVTEATEFNEQKNITGCLVFHGGHFLQILEGAENEVKSLFDKIMEDQRHSSVQLLRQEITEKQHFASWNMAFHGFDDREIKKMSQKMFKEDLTSFSQFVSKPTFTSEIFWTYVKILLEESED